MGAATDPDTAVSDRATAASASPGWNEAGGRNPPTRSDPGKRALMQANGMRQAESHRGPDGDQGGRESDPGSLSGIRSANRIDNLLILL